MDLLDLVGGTRGASTTAPAARYVAFSSWSSDELGALRGLGRAEVVVAGVEAVSAAEADRDLFVVAEGVLEVRRGGPDGPVVARLGPGDLFGEMAFIDGRPRSASVRAVTDARLVRITPDDLDRLAERDPALAYRFTRELAAILCDRLRSTA